MAAGDPGQSGPNVPTLVVVETELEAGYAMIPLPDITV